MQTAPSIAGRSLVIEGQVQGVGFRPFTYRLAHRYGLKGWVKNNIGRIEIYIKGSQASVDKFCTALISEAPPLAKPRILMNKPVAIDASNSFTILPSNTQSAANIHLPPDYAMCEECLAELLDADDRRYLYPFINCTHCGPRYTLILQLPYDRPNTTMAGFPLCARCRAEYENPADRRFHAQPLACPDCGPQLSFIQGNSFPINETQQALNACIAALVDGNIVAIKGVGGYHLVCDAQNNEVVRRLRNNKHRPAKPLAVMFPLEYDLAALRKAVILSKAQETLLLDPMRPIVLVQVRNNSNLADEIAPGLNEIGVMLPYSPLHFLLLNACKKPLVMTSANVSGEPVLIDQHDIETRFGHVADAYLHHNRPIARPADDPVWRVIHNKPRPLRLGRGIAPRELNLPFTLPCPLLAVGSHIKNTVALAWNDRVVVSPHIGDLDSPRSLDIFAQVIADLQALYHVHAQHLVCDVHPRYASTRWALQTGLPVTRVYHHHAHASSLSGEFPAIEKWLMFTWDGVGYGVDGTLWGGEALLGSPGQWQWVATLRPFNLPGGERAAREPWRSALALCWQTNTKWQYNAFDSAILYKAWEQHVNCPQTSAAGRLFDAAAALTGLVNVTSYEGQAPMMMQAAAHGFTGIPVMLATVKNPQGILESDWAPLLADLLDDKLAAGQRAANFHHSLAHTILAQACAIRHEFGEFTIGLTGGVFQNRLLTEAAIRLLNGHGFVVHITEKLPCNDGGLSYGQIIEAGSRM